MGKRLDLALAEADEIEAAELTADPDARIPAHVKVSRPNQVRSKVLQVRLTPEEFGALEAVAARRDVAASTVAREFLLRVLAAEGGVDRPVAVADSLAAIAAEVREWARRGVEAAEAESGPVPRG